MRIRLLEPQFTICKIPDMSAVDWNAPFCFAARTDEECSLVCPEDDVPAQALIRDDGWRAMRVEGVLDFSLVGILAGLTGVLAGQQIPVFAVSTFNTDYLLVKKEQLASAIQALQENDYEIEQ